MSRPNDEFPPSARVKEGCDCGCNTPVATTPEGMLRFLADRFEMAGVADSVARIYAHDIRLILKNHYDWKNFDGTYKQKV